MSYKLEYPYTEEEKENFIVEYSHNQGLGIEEVENIVEVEVPIENEDGETTTEIQEINMPTLFALEPWEKLVDGEVIDNTEEYEAKKARKEAERIQALYMTRSDFFDGTIQAWGVGQDELLILIQNLLATLPIENVKKLIAINNFKNALNFYRKHDLFKMLVNMPIPLTDTIQIILTDESLDKFFDEVVKGNKDTAWQYLPQPTAIPISSSQTETFTEGATEESTYDDI